MRDHHREPWRLQRNNSLHHHHQRGTTTVLRVRLQPRAAACAVFLRHQEASRITLIGGHLSVKPATASPDARKAASLPTDGPATKMWRGSKTCIGRNCEHPIVEAIWGTGSAFVLCVGTMCIYLTVAESNLIATKNSTMHFYQVKARVTNAIWSARATQPRPQVPRHRQTRYERMLLNTFSIPPFYNVMAAVATWLTLAGYIIFPGTFTSLQSSQAVRNAAGKVGGEAALKAVQNIGLLWLAAICCVVGLSTILWLWWRWYENYIWLLQRLFT